MFAQGSAVVIRLAYCCPQGKSQCLLERVRRQRPQVPLQAAGKARLSLCTVAYARADLEPRDGRPGKLAIEHMMIAGLPPWCLHEDAVQQAVIDLGSSNV